MTWVESVLPAATVAWGRTRLPREAAASTLASFNVVTGPASAGEGGASVRAWTLPTAATITVPAVSAGDYLTLRASGTSVTHQVTAGQDTEAARDSLLAALQASTINATFAARGTDQITLVCTPGDVYNLRGAGIGVQVTTDTAPLYGSGLIGTALIGGSTHTPASAPYLVQVDEAAYRVELQISSKSPYPMDGAAASMAELFASTDLPTVRDIRETFGLRVDMGTPINLDRLSGPAWESREVVDLNVTLVSLAAEQADRMVAVALSLETRNDVAILQETLISVAES